MVEMISKLMFAMAKEFGWTPDQVLNLPYRLFIMYARELDEYYQNMEAASNGHKPHKHLTKKEKKRQNNKLEKFANGINYKKVRT